MSKKQEAHLRIIGYKKYHNTRQHKFYTNGTRSQDIRLNIKINLATNIFACEEVKELLKLLNYELHE